MGKGSECPLSAMSGNLLRSLGTLSAAMSELDDQNTGSG